jgi:branched-chain amino acid transport system ATP-binding protein
VSHALVLSGVSAGYGSVAVLRDVDLAVAGGAVVALLGPNGAGKTTLLRVAAGQLAPTRGDVSVLGDDVRRSSTPREARRGLCLIPEGRGVFPKLTVGENLAMFVRGRGVDDATAIATSAFPVLGHRLEQVAGTLSGGEQQMLAVSRALVTEPRLVLADELSLGLAPAIVDEIFDVVAGLRSAGVSLLIVEQYVDRALAIADYVYVLDRGRVVLVEEAARCDHAMLSEHYLGGAA